MFYVIFRKVIYELNRIRFSSLIRFIFIYLCQMPVFIKIKEILKNKVRRLLFPAVDLDVFFIINKSYFLDINLLKTAVLDLFEKQFPLYRVSSFLKRVLYTMLKIKEIKGFKFLLIGRFSRRDRAVHRYVIESKVTFSCRALNVYHTIIPLFLEYGACNIHI